MNDMHCRPYCLVVIPIIFVMMMAMGCATTGPSLGIGVPPTAQGRNLFASAERFYEKGDLEQAAAGYENVLGSESGSYIADNALFRLGEIAMQQGDYVKSLKFFELLPAEYPESELIPSARFQAARSLYLNLSWEKALHALHKFREDFPMSQHNPAVMLLLSDIYIKTREYAQSKEVLATFFSQYPRSLLISSALYQLGLSEMYLGENERAFGHLQESLTGELPDDQREDALYALATLSLMKDDLLSSVEYFSDLYMTIQTGDRKERVLKKVTGLIQARLRDEDLQSLIERHPREFPGDLAIMEMAERSFNRGEISDVHHYLEAFRSGFPGHPETSALQERLTLFEKQPGPAAAGKFGCIAPLTDDLFAEYGEKMIRGVKMAIEEYNQKNGTDIKVVLFDSTGKFENAQKGVEVLAYEDKVTAIIGPLRTASATSAARTAERIGVPLFTPTAAGEGVPEIGRFIFRNCLTNRHQAESLATYAVEELGLTSFGILFPFIPYGKEMMALFSDKVEALGAHVEIIEFYDEDDTDFKDQIVRIHQVKPEALFMPGYFEKIVLIAPQIPFYEPEEADPNDPNILAEDIESLSGEDEIPLVPPEIAIGIEDVEEKRVETKREMQLLGTDGWYDRRLIAEGESYVENAVLSVGFYLESRDPRVRKFVSDFQKRYGEPPDLVSAQAYDATNMLLEASNGGVASWESTRKKLSQIQDFPGVSGRTTILPSGDSVKEVTLLRVKRRRFVPVERFPFSLN